MASQLRPHWQILKTCLQTRHSTIFPSLQAVRVLLSDRRSNHQPPGASVGNSKVQKESMNTPSRQEKRKQFLPFRNAVILNRSSQCFFLQLLRLRRLHTFHVMPVYTVNIQVYLRTRDHHLIRIFFVQCSLR